MNAEKIVFPTDFSEYSTAALRQATALARNSGATLLIVHVNDDVNAYTDTGFAGYPVASNDAELHGWLMEVKPLDERVPYKHKMLHGDPAEEIVKFATEEGADMIVMGTHGRRGLTRLLMGSVAEAVVRKAGCPVLTMKQPVETEATS
ncbi:MAG: nucleotide-binding universal stress UspA family protein [Pirellulaceae bacterium]|jgi:nucleotide-binding universal stress UspA family protein